MWNLWHGCTRKSEGCDHCYVYRRDAAHGIDSTRVRRTAAFELPLKKDRRHAFKVPAGTRLFTCFTSDFFLPEADMWRAQAWEMIALRKDLSFYIVTKRPERVAACLPGDFGANYDHVTFACTVENQRRALERVGLWRALPLRHRELICEPLLSALDLRGELGPWCEAVTVGGESGEEARVCDYAWVLDLRSQCMAAGVAFYFKQTGAWLRKDGRDYRIPRALQHQQARRAGINWSPALNLGQT